MKSKYTFFLALSFFLTLGSISSKAQTDVDLDSEFGGRISLAADKKLAKGLHLRLEEEIRFDNNFSSLDRLHTTLGLTYKLNNYVKLGIGYAMINPYSSSNSAFKNSRHRMMIDVTGGLRFGNWRLSLKERFQATYRTGDMNEYQNPRTALALKSRLKLSYKGLNRMEPYAYAEIRNTLNAPVINAYFDGTNYMTATFSQYGAEGWFIDSWNGVYVNRLRGSIGFSYRLGKNSSVDAALMADRVVDKEVDANSDGTKLKSYTREKGFVGWFAIGYNIMF